MFDYKEFKEKMKRRGHEVHKHGNIVTIKPNNNYVGYARGFFDSDEIIEEYEEKLSFRAWTHFNTWVYEAKYKII